jgi:HEAT repeat protein
MIHALAFLLALACAAPAFAQPEAGPDWVGLARKLDSSDKKERLNAVAAAAELGHERAAAYLRPLLVADGEREVRLAAVAALRSVPGEDAVALLGEGLADADPRVRRAVVEALHRRRESSAELHLARALQDKKPELRAAAALALGARLGADRAPLLLGGLDDRDASVREAALYALGAVGGETAVEALSGALTGRHNKRTKALAAEILGSMGSRAALPALVSTLDDADEEVLRPALQSAIRKILAQTPARVREEGRPAPPVSGSEPSPAAAPTEKAMTFRLKAPQARSVLLALDILAGKRKPMVRSVNGDWSVSLPLAAGRYRYQFIVDGVRTLDPANPAVERGASLLTVP